MAVNLSMLAGAGAQFFDNNGVILSGGLVYTYAAGTTTPQATYTTSAGNVAHTNPIVLNSAGRVASGGEIWLTDAVAYKFVLETSAAVTIATYDNITGNSSGIYAAFAASSGSSLVGYLAAPNSAVATTVQAKLRQIISIKDFGAVGNGVADDTSAIQAALTYAATTKNVSVYIPSGTYKITSSIVVPTSAGTNILSVDVYGDGYSSQILQYNNSSVFLFANLTYEVSFRNLSVIPKTVVTGTTSALFYFANGNCESYFENIIYYPSAGDSTNKGASFYVCPAGTLNDSVSFQNCEAVVTVYGYCIGTGSSIFINGGRIIGNYPTNATSIGLYLTGGNGGVWVWATDFIAHGTAVLVSADSGTSNREIFAVQAAFDSCNIGYSVTDASYNSLEGIWAASCNEANVNFAPSSEAAILNISGGTIFNAGNLGAGTPGNMYGLSVNLRGQINLSGVTFRNNKGRGFSSNSGARGRPCLIQNCIFYENGDTGVAVSCQAFLAGSVTLTNNTFVTGTSTYAVPNVTIDETNQSLLYVANNQGYAGFALRSTEIALGASNVNVTNNQGQRITIYIRLGTVNSVFINGNPVYDYGAGSAANCAITLNPLDTFKVVYSSAPTIAVYYN